MVSLEEEFYLQCFNVAADAQLLHEEGGVSEGWSSVAEVVEEVKILHQSESVDKVRAGEMWQL